MPETLTQTERPFLGFGLGLRTVHYEAVLREDPTVDWFELLSENYMVAGGKPLHYLDQICERYPVVMHGVSLSIGSTDPLDWDYLKRLKALAKRVEPAWVSDHLCWTGVDGTNLHDLMPLPYTGEAVEHVAARVRQAQDFLERRILLENVSSYVTYKQSGMTEWEFLTAVAERSDCLILLDINNIYVSSQNHDFDPIAYLEGVPGERVRQFHLAGHTHNGQLIIDSHDQSLIDPVWNLYDEAVRRFGSVSTMIERDDNIPPLAELLAELDQARCHHEAQLAMGSRVQAPARSSDAGEAKRPLPSAPLQRLQRDFESYVLRGDGADRIGSQIVGNDTAQASERLGVYWDAYRLRLLEVLETDFPALHTLLGDAQFEDLGHAYIDAHPSHAPSLRWFGRHMADYLRTTKGYASRPMLAEMAAFEWAQGEVFDAEDVRAIEPADMAALAPEHWARMCFELHPSVQRIDLTWNVPAAWAAIDAGEDPPLPARSDRPVTWVLWRNDHDVHWRSLDDDEAHALDRCARNASFGEICQDLLERLDPQSVPMRAATLVKQWASDGLMTRGQDPPSRVAPARETDDGASCLC